MKTQKQRQFHKTLFLLIIISIIGGIIYHQTRQVNIKAIASEIEWLQFINGVGEPVSHRDKNQINTYWNELGRKYIKVHLQDGREFNIHYFHSDTGNRRRVLIEVAVNSKADTALIRLFYNSKEVAKGNYQLTKIIGKTVDLMILNKAPNKNTALYSDSAAAESE